MTRAEKIKFCEYCTPNNYQHAQNCDRAFFTPKTMTPTHTPGPWKVSGTTPTMIVHDIPGMNGHDPIATVIDRDDAPMVAAAHTMLKALKDIVRWAQENNLDTRDDKGTEYSAIVHARYAIAQAEGRVKP